MTTALINHEDALRHITPDGHPERVARMQNLLPALDGKDLLRIEAPFATDDDILACHPQDYIDKIRNGIPSEGFNQLDGDTFLSPGSFDAALRAVGGALKGVDMVMAGEAQNAFVAMRPPGHHAETSTPMGFCLFGNVALAAKHALERHGLSRVAVVDFDVHHGNGTQDLLWSETRSLFISSHQMPLWPGSGAPSERGAANNVMNVPLDPATSGVVFRQKYEAQVFPALETFKPQLIIVSAGFDAHAADPLANINLLEDDFAWVTERTCDVADKHAEGRVVSCLEGGYDLAALAASTAAHVDVLIARGSG
ncbi:MAG: histone deacetylase family protein [Pseudomonadota bacterium]